MAIKNDEILATACVEKYSPDSWDLSDVRTLTAFQGNGYAGKVCRFITDYILSKGKTATCYTREDNSPMISILLRLGYTEIKRTDRPDDFYNDKCSRE